MEVTAVMEAWAAVNVLAPFLYVSSLYRSIATRGHHIKSYLRNH